MTGTILSSRYELLEQVGIGGMAYVYKAYDKMLNRSVAVKILREEFRSDEEFIHRFKVESQAAACLSNPNIVTIYDVGEQDGIQYIVMELLEGITLKDYIAKNGKIYWREALDFAIQICSALEHAHSKKVIHRDIKPQNIMITSSKTLKVTDFGIARAASRSTTDTSNTALGSAHYLSPEQARGGFTDNKSDIYSLGVVMYEMVTGKVPFEGDNAVAVVMQHLQDAPVPPSEINPEVPKSVENIILKAMNKEQRLRYQSATEMLYDLRLVYMDPDVDISVPASFGSGEGLGGTKRISIPKDALESGKNTPSQTQPQRTKPKKQDEDETPSKAKQALAMLSAILLALCLCGAAFYFLWQTLFPGGITSGDDVAVVPNLYNMTLSEAQTELESIGLKLSLDYETAPSSEVESGRIIEQSIDADMEVKPGREISVTLSSGAENYFLESFIDRNDAAAIQVNLASQGYIVNIVYENSDTVASGYIIRQTPVSGTPVSKGDTITLYVSEGAAPPSSVTVPNVVGMPYETEAVSTIVASGLTAIYKERDSTSENKGKVMEQSPAANSAAYAGDTVILYVGNGKVVLKTKQIYLDWLSKFRGRVAIEVRCDGETVYSSTFDADNYDASSVPFISVTGSGVKKYDIYCNGTLYTTQTVDFN